MRRKLKPLQQNRMYTSNLMDHLEAGKPLPNRARVFLGKETRGKISLSKALLQNYLSAPLKEISTWSGFPPPFLKELRHFQLILWAFRLEITAPRHSSPVFHVSTAQEKFAPGARAHFHLQGNLFRQMAAEDTLASEKCPHILHGTPSGGIFPKPPVSRNILHQKKEVSLYLSKFVRHFLFCIGCQVLTSLLVLTSL